MSACNVCGRTLDNCGTCVCIKRPLDAFMADVFRDVVGPPSLEVLPPGTAECPECGDEVRLVGFCATCDGERSPATARQRWRFIAEEHGDCLREFLEVGVQPALVYEQASIAAHFARLYLESGQ